MSENIIPVTYLLVYILEIIYFVVLACYMLAQRGNLLSTHGEQKAKLRMTRTMGITLLVWAFDLFLYLPPLLHGCTPDHPIYKLIFLVNLLLATPMIYAVMFAVVQRQVSQLKWASMLSLPFLLLIIWHLLAPAPANDLPCYIAAALSMASYLFLLIRFASEYRAYTRRLKSEYSETASREIVWSWFCFSGLVMQGILFVVFEQLWSPTAEIFYFIFSVVNAASLCYCIVKQHTIDLDVVPESEPEAGIEDKIVGNTVYATIEQRLKMFCEDKLLFLDPDLTRETLCLRLAINRTYLSMYLRHCGTTYYQYINSLRIEHAVKLMRENPQMPISEVSRQSGFRTQATFRRAFQEVMGCLPSDIRKG